VFSNVDGMTRDRRGTLTESGEGSGEWRVESGEWRDDARLSEAGDSIALR
jgi:hypothetical protein